MPRLRRHSHGPQGPYRSLQRLLPWRGPVTGLTLACLVLSACNQAEPYASPRFPFLGGYFAQKSASPVLLSNASWWTGFEDPLLEHLVTVALADNLSIAAARERIVAARASSRSLESQFSVTSSVGAQVRSDDSSDDPEMTGSIGLAWMLDPYGLRREQIKALGARVDAADAEAEAAHLLVLFNLCNAYVDLRYYQRLLELRRQEIVSRRRTLDLASGRLAADVGLQLEVTQARARMSDVEAQIPALEAQVRIQMNEIAVLTGRTPGTLGVDLTRGRGQPQASLAPEVGIPADLLRNRPDIRVAERLYYAAVAEVGASKVALYPRLSLSGAISLTSLNGAAAGRESYFGPVLSLPVLPTEAGRAAVDQRRSAARLALTGWKSTVLDAILEVENALLSYQASQKARFAADRSLKLYREAQGMVTDLIESGASTIDALIDADESVTDAANTVAETRRQQGLAFIALNVRLGSGSAAGSNPLLASQPGN